MSLKKLIEEKTRDDKQRRAFVEDVTKDMTDTIINYTPDGFGGVKILFQSKSDKYGYEDHKSSLSYNMKGYGVSFESDRRGVLISIRDQQFSQTILETLEKNKSEVTARLIQDIFVNKLLSQDQDKDEAVRVLYNNIFGFTA